MDSYWSVEEWNKILRVIARFKDHFLSHPLVNCIGVTRIWKGEIGVLGGDPAIFIGLEEYRPKIESFIPRQLMDFPTTFKEIGRVEMLSQRLEYIPLTARTERWRPAPGGVSIGHVRITAGCVTEDTLVLCTPGFKRIVDVKPGTKVWVFTPNGAKVANVVRFYDNGVRDVYLLRTQTGREIKATDYHPFLVLRRVVNPRLELYNRALELRRMGFTISRIAKILNIPRRTVRRWINGVCRPKEFVWILKWEPLSNIGIGDHIVILTERPFEGRPLKLPRIAKYRRKLTIVRTTEDFMFVVGYFLGDGNLVVRKKNNLYKVVFAEGDYKKAEKIILLLKKMGLHAKYYPKRCLIECRSGSLCMVFKKLGLEGNAHTKRVPPWVFTLPKGQIEAFIRGFIFADGYLHKSKTREKRYGIEICNYELLKGIQLLAQLIGWRTTSIHKRYRERRIEGRVIKGETYYMDIYEPVEKGRHKYYSSKICSRVNLPKYFGIDRVVEIKHIGKERVYDIETDCEEHNFIANNIVIHNSFGCRVFDKYTGRRLILSNNHVIALNWGTMMVGRKGDPILQPGPYDGGKDPDDRIGYLERWVDVEPYPFENLIDAAVALPVSDDVIRDDVLEIGIPGPVVEPDVGSIVKKSGRTTGLSKAKIICVSATVDVMGWGSCRFTDQIVTECMAEPGDSGSYTAVDSPENQSVGLVFAGSDEVTVVCKASHIEEMLNVSFTPVPIPEVPPIPIVPLMAAGMFVGFLIASAGYSYAKRVKMM